jgi:hypothetical protein
MRTRRRRLCLFVWVKLKAETHQQHCGLPSVYGYYRCRATGLMTRCQPAIIRSTKTI